MTTSDEQAREVDHWQVLAFRARSFRWASALLTRAQRRRVAALYAFCRAVDDLADADWVSPEAQRDLDALQRAIAAEPNGEELWPPQFLWFRELCLETGIDFPVVQDLLDGMVSDLDLVRVQSDTDLVRYCYRAAGTVGLMMCSVLGVRDMRALRHAIDLGIAMQLTNISRDVLEDARACRVYLPAERLADYGVTHDDLVDGRADGQSVSVVVSDVLDIAERYYESGDAGMRFLPARARWAILVASRLYRGIGRRLRRRQQSNPLLGRVFVPWFQKLGLVASATASWFRLTVFPPSRPPVMPYRDAVLGLPGARERVSGSWAAADAVLDSALAVAVADASAVTDAGTSAAADAGTAAGASAVPVVARSRHALGHTH